MEILYSDKDIVSCIKPVGVDSEKQMIDLLKTELQGEFFPVHRLDLNVSGVMVYARNRNIAAVPMLRKSWCSILRITGKPECPPVQD